MARRSCKVCDEAQSKYKCPTCLIPYCSLVCFKKHKELPCDKPVLSPEVKLNPGPPVHVEKPIYVDEPSEILQWEQLESIASFGEIRNALKDENIQKLIYNIDCSPAAEYEFDKAREVEAFRMLTDKILSVITP